MSYVFPAAQCDLGLDLNNKGLLNAITYIGMMSSGLIWGYLCDTLGRKKLLYIGFFIDALFVITSSLSQTFTVLMISKFFGGFIINGPFAALTTYVSEFHCAKYRARVQMVLGIIFSSATVCLPLLAQFILPVDINFTILNNLRIHSWNVYLLVTALPALLAGLIFIFLPESPKFLMTTGKNDEALAVFQMVYSMNTGKPGNTFPITKLIDERKNNEHDLNNRNSNKMGGERHAFKDGWSALRPLFIPPLLQNILLVCGLQMLIMLSLNTLRLWIPQLFQAINDYEYYNNGTSADLCTMLDVIRPSNETLSKECVVNTNNSQVYINSMIIAAVTVFGYIVAGSLINILGKKRLLFILGTMGGLSAYILYFASSTAMTLILASCYVTVGSIGVNVMLSVVVDLFPTTLRTMTVSMAMMCGRLGAMSGNLLFPILLKTGCAAPFYTIGTVMLSTAFISLFLPNTDMKALQ
ncbi:hypothetical protein WA026_004113 [Henosepilachna vigintioctopunctata]